jgi:O-antigen ligase
MGELGIIGTVVWFVFLKSYFMRAWQFIRKEEADSALRNLCLAVLVATIVRLVIGMATHSVYIFFWYMMAGVVVVLVGINSNLRGKEQFQERRIRV